MKKYLLIVCSVFLFACKANAADVTLFYMPTCPHCHHAMGFFEKEMKTTTVEKVDVSKGGKNAERFFAQLKKCNITSQGVPLMVIKGKCLQGFGSESGDKIKNMLK